MTLVEFNDKYEDYLADRHYGLAIDDARVIAYLDSAFQEIIAGHPRFRYFQIKLKFGDARFYSTLSETEEGHELATTVEHNIEQILREGRTE